MIHDAKRWRRSGKFAAINSFIDWFNKKYPDRPYINKGEVDVFINDSMRYPASCLAEKVAIHENETHN